MDIDDKFVRFHLTERQRKRVQALLDTATAEHDKGKPGAVIFQVGDNLFGNAIAKGIYVDYENAEKIKAILISQLKGHDSKGD